MKTKSLKIFIVEDNDSIVKMLSEILSKNLPTSEILTFKSVENALGKVNENPDYIILDHFLEKTNGIDCIPLFKEFIPNAKIIVTSSQNDIKTFENAFIYGANEYFRKDALFPINIVEFIKKDFEKEDENWLQSFFNTVKRKENSKCSKNLVYVLDDNKNTAFSIEHVLQNESLNEVYSFNHSKDFFAQLKSRKPDFVILDYNIEETISGADVLKEVKLISPDTKVIIFSGQTDVGTASNLLKLGAMLYMSKSNENIKKLKTIVN